MDATNGRRLSHTLQNIFDSCRAAVLVKDADGYCVYANAAAEALFDYPADQLMGMHLTELGVADVRLITKEFERLKREECWAGRYPVRRRDGAIIPVAAVALIQTLEDDSMLCAEFLHPLAGLDLGPPGAPREAPELSAWEVCLLQLTADGLDERQIAQLFGSTQVDPAVLKREVLSKMGVASKTEACIRAIKARLVA